ncbi:MAG TPA: DUF4339 domain-containing protein, partial [Pyrodictiaceae archaeon]|nr:DUF4339 domain-containing protein [Pyrodictiaceae archaeon]
MYWLARFRPALPASSIVLGSTGRPWGLVGPYTLDQSRSQARGGEFTPEMLVWAQGMPNWQA